MPFPNHTTVRSASLNGYVALAQDVGLDAHDMLRRAGLHARMLANPETPIGTQVVSRLLADSAKASGVGDFGLRLAARRGLSNLGPVSLVLRGAPTVREALDSLCRYLRLLNTALVTQVEEQGGVVRISEDLLPHTGDTPEQAMQLAVGVMVRILQALLGADWRPLGACFKQAQPPQPDAFTGFFHCPVAFGAPFNGLLCRAVDLEQPPQEPQPHLAAFARHVLDGAMQQEANSTPVTVRQLVTVLLPSGRCTAQLVAQHLGVDRRTLHRYLGQGGTRFSVVLQQVRLDMAHHQLRHSQRPLSEVATLLGFRAPSAFSDWFRRSTGGSARAYRQQP